jgi:hypothetical protein
MIGVRINQAKSLFFDRKAVLDKTTAAERRVLSKFGAFVRTSARSSMRKRKRPSAPGQPPSAHVGLIKRFLFFVYDPQRKSVVIGPAKLNKPSDNALEVLEHGGQTTILSRRRDSKSDKRTANIAARPFMQPAFDKNLPQVPSMWRDQIR